MSKGSIKPMTRAAVSRIAAKEAKGNDGKIPAGGFTARADARLQQKEAAHLQAKAVKS